MQIVKKSRVFTGNRLRLLYFCTHNRSIFIDLMVCGHGLNVLSVVKT